MDLKKASDLLVDYKKAVEKSQDACFIIHFSREDDKYAGACYNLDLIDLGIVIREFFNRLAIAIQDAPDGPAFIHYGLAKNVRDNVDKIIKMIEE